MHSTGVNQSVGVFDPYRQTLRDDLKLKMKEVDAKKLGTEVLLEEMGVQRSEAEAQQVRRPWRHSYECFGFTPGVFYRTVFASSGLCETDTKWCDMKQAPSRKVVCVRGLKCLQEARITLMQKLALHRRLHDQGSQHAYGTQFSRQP